MADFREKYVRQSLARIHDREFVLDRVDRAEGEAKAGDILEFPAVSSMTVVTGSGSNTAQAATADNLTMTVNQEPAIFVQLPKLDAVQSLGGSWAAQLAQVGLTNLRNNMDETYLTGCATAASAGLNANFTANAAGDSLSRADFVAALGILADQDGSLESNFMWVLDPWAHMALRNLADWMPNNNAEAGNLGIPIAGTLFGIPVLQSRSVPRSVSIATSAVTESGGTAVATVAAGHNIVPGETITTTLLTTNDADVVVSAVTSTSISYPSTGSGAFADGVGLITSQCARSMLIDTSYSHAALQSMPSTRIKPVAGTTTDELEISCVFGHATRTGRCVQLFSPVGSL